MKEKARPRINGEVKTIAAPEPESKASQKMTKNIDKMLKLAAKRNSKD